MCERPRGLKPKSVPVHERGPWKGRSSTVVRAFGGAEAQTLGCAGGHVFSRGLLVHPPSKRKLTFPASERRTKKRWLRKEFASKWG